MQRRIIQQSSTSVGISLPSAWVRRQGLRKGDALEVFEKDDVIEIRTPGFIPPKRVAVVDAHAYGKLSRRLFDNLSKQGYDEIEVLYREERELAPIQETLAVEATMFEIVHKDGGRAVVRAVSETGKRELGTLMNRLVFLLLEKVRVARSYLEGAGPGALDELLDLERANNRIAHLCMRAIHRQPQEEESYVRYTFLWAAEKLGNDFKFLAHARPSRVSEEAKRVLLDALGIVAGVADLYFRYDPGKAAALYDARNRAVERGLQLLRQRKPCGDLVHVALSMAERSVHLLGLLFTTGRIPTEP